MGDPLPPPLERRRLWIANHQKYFYQRLFHKSRPLLNFIKSTLLLGHQEVEQLIFNVKIIC